MLSIETDKSTLENISELEDSEKIRGQIIPNVRTVLIVLSADGIVFDLDSLRQKVLISYPDAAVFFKSTMGLAHGAVAPQKVDLLIDFTGPGQRQGLFYAKTLRRSARFAVGRNAGFFRKRIYDRIFDEKKSADQVPHDMLERERFVEKKVLALVGVVISQVGMPTHDRAKVIALDLPPLSRQ